MKYRSLKNNTKNMADHRTLWKHGFSRLKLIDFIRCSYCIEWTVQCILWNGRRQCIRALLQCSTAIEDWVLKTCGKVCRFCLGQTLNNAGRLVDVGNLKDESGWCKCWKLIEHFKIVDEVKMYRRLCLRDSEPEAHYSFSFFVLTKLLVNDVIVFNKNLHICFFSSSL